MSMKLTRRVDESGRVIIPTGFREKSNILPGSYIEISVEEDGSIRIQSREKRCMICGKTATLETEKIAICHECAKSLVALLEK